MRSVTVDVDTWYMVLSKNVGYLFADNFCKRSVLARATCPPSTECCPASQPHTTCPPLTPHNFGKGWSPKMRFVCQRSINVQLQKLQNNIFSAGHSLSCSVTGLFVTITPMLRLCYKMILPYTYSIYGIYLVVSYLFYLLNLSNIFFTSWRNSIHMIFPRKAEQAVCICDKYYV